MMSFPSNSGLVALIWLCFHIDRMAVCELNVQKDGEVVIMPQGEGSLKQLPHHLVQRLNHAKCVFLCVSDTWKVKNVLSSHARELQVFYQYVQWTD